MAERECFLFSKSNNIGIMRPIHDVIRIGPVAFPFSFVNDSSVKPSAWTINNLYRIWC